MTATAQLDAWKGDLGDDYTARCAHGAIEPRRKLWREILVCMKHYRPMTVLEVGCNVGLNIQAIVSDWPPCTVIGVEPNLVARETAMASGLKVYDGQAEQLDYAPDSFDLVFTCGVLIHLSPEGSPGLDRNRAPLSRACREIVRVSKRWIVAVEYFSAEPREVSYRDRPGLLWTRDFGKFYVDECGLKPVACGFAWKELTGLDNLTWVVLRKP